MHLNRIFIQIKMCVLLYTHKISFLHRSLQQIIIYMNKFSHIYALATTFMHDVSLDHHWFVDLNKHEYSQLLIMLNTSDPSQIKLYKIEDNCLSNIRTKHWGAAAYFIPSKPLDIEFTTKSEQHFSECLIILWLHILLTLNHQPYFQ